MNVRVKRNTGFVGILGNYQIYLNGEKNKKISHKSEVEVRILEENTELQVRQSGIKSNKIKVSPGDVVEINQTFIGRYSLFIILFTNLLTTLFINNLTLRTFISGTMLVAIIITFILMFVEGTHVKVHKTYSPTSEVTNS